MRCGLLFPVPRPPYMHGVLGLLAPVHRCARSVHCVTCAVSWATWLLFTGVLARCVVLRVRCPGPFGSCSPVCSLGVLCCVGGVVDRLAPVQRCARSVCCVARAVSWATWLLFTGVQALCVVLCVRCPGPLGSCSPVRTLGLLCRVRGVLGHLAPVHRCAPPVCCAVYCVCGVPSHLTPVHRCARWVCCVACARRRCGARTRPSGRRLFVAGRGCVPSGRAHVNPDGGCFVAGRGCVPSGHAHVRPDGGCSVAGRGWVRCRVRTRPSGRRRVLPGTCSRAVVRCVLCALSGFAAPDGRCHLALVRVPWLWPAACLSGVPRGPAWCAAPHPVRSLLVLRWAFPTTWCLSPPWGLSPPDLLSSCAGHADAGREPRSLCLPLAPAEAGALGSLRVVPVRGPAKGLFLAGPSGVGLGLRALRWFACVDPVTDASGTTGAAGGSSLFLKSVVPVGEGKTGFASGTR